MNFRNDNVSNNGALLHAFTLSALWKTQLSFTGSLAVDNNNNNDHCLAYAW